mmetsp:Transcript_26075/g.78265  ORF Transcript_26075/g.78265 Transcript_26075/m.78265 type:complete len:150 (+) Transcript_26075:115-564(+)
MQRALVLSALLASTAAAFQRVVARPLARPAGHATHAPHAPAALRPQTQLNMVIPGDTTAEFVVLGGFINFLGLYNSLITVRILLSWFPQAQGQPVLQPLFVVTDPFLNLFRGLIPPIGGLDLSILPALFLLQALGNAVPALSAGTDLLL